MGLNSLRGTRNMVEDASMHEAILVKSLEKSYRIPHERKITFYQHFASIIGKYGYSYEHFKAIQDLSFSVNHGETFGIIGPNGSGKSTILKMLAGVIYPDSGSICINGRIAPFLELGVGFQPDLTARENVFLYGAIMGMTMKKIREKYEEIMDFAELKRFENMKLRNFSSGMYVRLAFSTAIQTNPDILLVDEVLAVGDEHFKRKCSEKVVEMQKAGKTILIVSHDMELIRKLCERCMLIKGGKVLSLGESGWVVDDYLKMLSNNKKNSVKH